MSRLLSVTVVGAAGVVGGELLRLLVHHPQVDVRKLRMESTSNEGKRLSDVHADILGLDQLRFTSSLNGYSTDICDVIFVCSGHGESAAWINNRIIDESVVIVDLSADHRAHADWVYGLAELHKVNVASSTRIANPGCFATCIELGLLPVTDIVKSGGTSVVVNALTGTTGSGQQPTSTNHFSWRSNNVSVYKCFTHQHLAEISTVLGFTPTFVPMRGPFARGIFSTSVFSSDLDLSQIQTMYHDYYHGRPFIHIVNDLPDVKRVAGTNMCCIGIEKHGDDVIVVSVIDNLMKGAAGQAIQNMNLACGLQETIGLLVKGVAF